jgi:hypothetical protein
MGLVAPLGSLEITPTVAVAWRRSILRSKALHRRPRLDQRPIHREVLRGHQAILLSLLNDRSQESLRHFVTNQTLSVPRKRTRIERRLVELHVQEPPKQQVVLQLLTELTITAHRVQRDQQLGLQQPFRWHRRPPRLCIHRREYAAQLLQGCVSQPLDLAKRVRLRHPLLDRTHHQERPLFSCFSSHAQKMMDSMIENKPFSAAC